MRQLWATISVSLGHQAPTGSGLAAETAASYSGGMGKCQRRESDCFDVPVEVMIAVPRH